MMVRPALQRRAFCASLAAGLALRFPGLTTDASDNWEDEPSTKGRSPAERKRAQVAITLDLEMSRNFPTWEQTHWDYEKGNLNDECKAWAREAGRRVLAQGGRIHYFCVGRVLEQENVQWLAELAAEGHPIGNHTYDHVNVLAKSPSELQYRFQRAPWLIEGQSTEQVIRENIRRTTLALRQRIQIENCGFRTPGGFATGLDGRADLQQLLLESGFTWVSSKYPAHVSAVPDERPSMALLDDLIARQPDAQPYRYPSGLIEIPMNPISDIGAFRTGRWKLEWFLEAIERTLVACIEGGLVFDFLAHPSCLGIMDPEFRSIDLICRLTREAGESAELTTLDQIANRIA